MAEITNVFAGLGLGRGTYKEFQDIGILTGPRMRPRMLDKGMNGFYLGMHDPLWAATSSTPSGAETYYVRVVPSYSKFIDPDSNTLKGTPNTENTTKGTTFYFDSFPSGYACDGYQVWAGTTAGTLYLQGTLSGRFLTTFTIGVTWSYTSSGSTLDALVIGPPAFADLVSVYQGEGEINSRVILAGGRKYIDGYAKVAASAVAPVLTCEAAGSATFGDWEAITDGSMRMRIDDYVHDFVDIDFTGGGSMANVASTLQTKIRAAMDPKLISGSGVETTIASWTAISDGSFNIKVNGVSYDVEGCDFSGDASMADVASTIQTQLQADIDANLTCTWDSTASRLIIEGYDGLGDDKITNGGFASGASWSTGTNWSIGSGVANYLYAVGVHTIRQDTGFDMRGKTIRVGMRVKVTTAGGVDTLNVYLGGADADDPGATILGSDLAEALDTDGSFHTYSQDVKCDITGATNDFLHILIDSAAGGDYDIDDVTLVEVPGTANSLGYCDRDSTETGTDISILMACRVDSTGIVLNRFGKDATTETVAWSTDKFIITGSTTGSAKRLSFLEAVTADVGTDISGASWMNGLSSSQAVYTPGQTAKRSVLGTGTNWGEWATGMEFRGNGESEGFLIKEVRSATELVLDEDYDGDLFSGYAAYLLEPFDAQIYESDLGNPFAFRVTNIQKIPVDKSEGITTLKTSGVHTAIMMQESTWIIDSVDITSPLRVSPDDGCPNNEAAIEYDNGVAFFSGDDFKALRGRDIISIDPEDRMRAIIGRMSSNAPYPMGVYLPSPKASILVWAFGLDNSYTYNVAVCWNPKTGAWWLWNLKDVNCLTALKNASGKFFLATGSQYDDSHSVPSFVKLYSRTYFNDGASQSSSNTKQGTIATGGIGSPSTIAGYLTCATASSATYGDWTGITAGYFQVTIDDVVLKVGPVDLSGAGSMAAIATLMQTAVRAATGAGGAEVVAWSTDHFVITSGTTTNRSNVSYLRPYYPTTGITDLSDGSWMNGQSNAATKTGAVNTITLTLQNWDDDASAVLSTTNDGEKGVYLAFCEADGQSLQYGLVTANAAGTVTITPVPTTLPEAGWRWFLGGIVPTWMKWFDFGSPQHLQKVVALAFSSNPDQTAARNFLHLLYYHDLKSSVRKSITQQLGTTIDTVNTLQLKDREATQHGFKMIRPSSERDLVIEDITITHHPLV